MAAAGTTVTECIYFIVRLVKGKMNKTGFIRFTQYFRGLPKGNRTCPAFFYGLFTRLIEQETDLEWFIAPGIMYSAATVLHCNGSCVAHDFKDLLGW